MATLLLRLAGPMQSWGTRSRFTIRDTGRDPSKSGVIGLLCAALGKPRLEVPGDKWPTLAELAALRLGIRVDQEGRIASDYHTAGGGNWNGRDYGVYKANGKAGAAVVSSRFYLSGAHFLVGLEGAPELLDRLQLALQEPVWQMCLGRRSFLPSIPICLPERPPEGPGLREEGLEDALMSVPLGHPLDPPTGKRSSDDKLRFVLDATTPEDASETRADVPLDFAQRRFGKRQVRILFKSIDEVAKR